MQINGWMETENGALSFDIEGASMISIARQLRALDADAGHTDMEANDADGEDVTQRLYVALNGLDS